MQNPQVSEIQTLLLNSFEQQISKRTKWKYTLIPTKINELGDQIIHQKVPSINQINQVFPRLMNRVYPRWVMVTLA